MLCYLYSLRVQLHWPRSSIDSHHCWLCTDGKTKALCLTCALVRVQPSKSAFHIQHDCPGAIMLTLILLTLPACS